MLNICQNEYGTKIVFMENVLFNYLNIVLLGISELHEKAQVLTLTLELTFFHGLEVGGHPVSLILLHSRTGPFF